MTDANESLRCPHFGDCGGCSSLTTPFAIQRAGKIARVESALAAHLRGQSVQFTDTPATPARHDRMRVLYPVQPSGDGPTMGLYRRGTHDIVELASCEIQHPALTELGRRALPILRAHGLRPYDERTHRGSLRAFTARLAATTGELIVGVITKDADLPGMPDLADELLAAAQGLPAVGEREVHPVGVVHNVNPERGNALLGPVVHTLIGRDHITERFGDLVFRISFLSFHQLHRHAEALLYGPALARLGSLDGLAVMDAYGGIGTFALRLARAGASDVCLVELHPTACADARHNVAANGCTTVRVVEAAFDQAELPDSLDLLVVDPTRAGLGLTGCAQANRLGAPRILYVACGLRALARDLARLPAYEISRIQLADLFPHTEHVEIIALLERRSGRQN